jgi:hypothetical protein
MNALYKLRIACGLVLCLLSPAWTAAQTTELKAEYLMTYMALLEPPYKVDDTLLIVSVKPGGWAKGPKINGSFIQPGGDWLRILPSGNARLDVRATLKTDDDQIIYLTYNGIIQHTKESAEKLGKGELVTHKDWAYFITAPTFQTSSEKYAWLNGIQAVNKAVEVKLGPDGGYVKYDVYVMR